MPSRRGGFRRSNSSMPFKKSQPAPRPPPQQKKGGNLIIVQPRQSGILSTFAGTAAGVAAGSVIGDKLTSKGESNSTQPAGEAMPSAPCQSEEQQFLICAQNQAQLQVCEAFKQIWMDCKRKLNS